MAQDFGTWLSSLGKVTRLALGCTTFLSAVSTFGLVSPYHLVLLRVPGWMLQVWRPLTASLFFGNFSFAWLLNVAMFVTYMNYVEQRELGGVTADFVYLLLFVIAGLTPLGLLFGMPLLSAALTMALCWVFCKRNPHTQMSLYGFAFRASIFPWVLFALHVVLGGQGVFDDVSGILVGHAYLFLQDVLPRTHHLQLLRTPQWLHRVLARYTAPRAGGSGGGAYTPMHAPSHPSDARFAPRTSVLTGRHVWGSSGQRLGSN